MGIALPIVTFWCAEYMEIVFVCQPELGAKISYTHLYDPSIFYRMGLPFAFYQLRRTISIRLIKSMKKDYFLYRQVSVGNDVFKDLNAVKKESLIPCHYQPLVSHYSPFLVRANALMDATF
jgi:hypothetical protein